MQQNLIALGMFFVMLCFVYYKYLLSPLQQKYHDANQKLQSTESKLTEMRRRAMELPKLQAEMKLLEEEVTDLEKRLPKDKEIPELLRTVTKTAQRFQLKISNFAPGGVSAQSNYNEVPFQITLQGTYHALAHFLAEVGQESRILAARNITFAAGQQSKNNEATVSVNFTLIAYTFKG